MKGAARGAAFDMKGIPAAARSCASGQRGGGLCGGCTVPRGEKVLGETARRRTCCPLVRPTPRRPPRRLLRAGHPCQRARTTGTHRCTKPLRLHRDRYAGCGRCASGGGRGGGSGYSDVVAAAENATAAAKLTRQQAAAATEFRVQGSPVAVAEAAVAAAANILRRPSQGR